jgi:hypothetical protein
MELCVSVRGKKSEQQKTRDTKCRGLSQTEAKVPRLAFVAAVTLGALAIFFCAVLAIARFAIAGDGIGLVAFTLGAFAIFLRAVLAVTSFTFTSDGLVASTLSAIAIFFRAIFAIARFASTCVGSNVQRVR